jgi:hypothetical protein
VPTRELRRHRINHFLGRQRHARPAVLAVAVDEQAHLGARGRALRVRVRLERDRDYAADDRLRCADSADIELVRCTTFVRVMSHPFLADHLLVAPAVEIVVKPPTVQRSGLALLGEADEEDLHMMVEGIAGHLEHERPVRQVGHVERSDLAEIDLCRCGPVLLPITHVVRRRYGILPILLGAVQAVTVGAEGIVHGDGRWADVVVEALVGANASDERADGDERQMEQSHGTLLFQDVIRESNNFFTCKNITLFFRKSQEALISRVVR